MRDVHHGDTHSVSSDGNEKASTPTNADMPVKRFDEGITYGQHTPLRGNPPPPNNNIASSATPAGNFV
jgi:Amt family ammonium transporter